VNSIFERSISICLFGRRLLSVTRTVTNKSLSPPQVAPSLPEVEAVDPSEQPLTFVANSLFLYDCFKALTRTLDENLHAVTGSTVGNLRVLERIVPLQLSRQSVAGAEADDESLADQMINLYDFGLTPLAYFHSHPGLGTSATQPSNTDRETQAGMEKCGAKIIGGIFSRDGFIRFYANDFKPILRVGGNHVKEIEPNVYHLQRATENVHR
jgi:hypothetical protein